MKFNGLEVPADGQKVSFSARTIRAPNNPIIPWNDVAQAIQNAFAKTIQQGKVTYDLERLMTGATKLKTSEFGRAIVENL